MAHEGTMLRTRIKIPIYRHFTFFPSFSFSLSCFRSRLFFNSVGAFSVVSGVFSSFIALTGINLLVELMGWN